jgi:hypothetical protein
MSPSIISSQTHKLGLHSGFSLPSTTQPSADQAQGYSASLLISARFAVTCSYVLLAILFTLLPIIYCYRCCSDEPSWILSLFAQAYWTSLAVRFFASEQADECEQDMRREWNESVRSLFVGVLFPNAIAVPNFAIEFHQHDILGSLIENAPIHNDDVREGMQSRRTQRFRANAIAAIVSRLQYTAPTTT